MFTTVMNAVPKKAVAYQQDPHANIKRKLSNV
jgi:hypothetical protein